MHPEFERVVGAGQSEWRAERAILRGLHGVGPERAGRGHDLHGSPTGHARRTRTSEPDHCTKSRRAHYSKPAGNAHVDTDSDRRSPDSHLQLGTDRNSHVGAHIKTDRNKYGNALANSPTGGDSHKNGGCYIHADADATANAHADP